MYLHQLFKTPRKTIPIGNHLSLQACKIEWKGSRLYISEPSRNRELFINGIKTEGGYLFSGDWLVIESNHFLVSDNPDHHLVTTPINSFDKKWSKKLKSLPFLAQSNEPVLILGESGSGKEILFESIHKYSSRSSEKATALNCGALSDSLIESELFGHKKGAFTGAVTDRKGAFESCKKGTLFLDEIGDFPINLQPTLLRALENKQIRPVGSDSIIKTDVRIVSATHREINKRIKHGLFRQDLFYRLGVIQLKIPSLTERMSDFDGLLNYFCKLQKVAFSFESIKALKKHSWPGNIRELKNMVHRAKAMFPYSEIDLEKTIQLIDEFTISSPAKDFNIEFESTSLNDTFEAFRKDLIIERLRKYAGNQRKAAKSLGIPKSTLHDKIKKYGLDMGEFAGG